MEDFVFKVEYLPMSEVFRVLYGYNGQEKTKVLDTENLIRLLSEVADGEGHPNLVQIGPFPESYIKGKMDVNSFTGTLYYKVSEGRRPVKYRKGDESYNCVLHYPKMIFKVTVGCRKFQELSVYCYEGELCDDTLLYELPMSNVYNGGRICTGHNSLNFPEFNDFFGIEGVMDVFFSSPYNGDLWNNLKYGCTFMEKLKELEKDGFVTKRMIPIGKYAEVTK